MTRIAVAVVALAVGGCACGPSVPPDGWPPPHWCVPLDEAEYLDWPDAVRLQSLLAEEPPTQFRSEAGFARLRPGDSGAARIDVSFFGDLAGDLSPGWMMEIGLDGRLVRSFVEPTGNDRQWGDTTIVWGLDLGRDRASTAPDVPIDRRIVWQDFVAPRTLLDIRPDERWPRSDEGCSIISQRQQLQATSDHLWLFRTRCEPTYGVQMHVFRRDGTELTPPEGRALPPLQTAYSTLESTVAPLPDGSVWILAILPGAAGDEREALRALRLAADGTTLAISAPLAELDVIGTRPDGDLDLHGEWARADAEGAYLVHFAAHNGRESGYSSHFARIETDGTIAWRWFSPGRYLATAGDFLEDTRLAEDDGGIVALMAHWPSGGNRLWLMRITRDGERPLDDAPPLLLENDHGPDIRSDIRNAEVVVDPSSGNLFVAFEDEIRVTSVRTFSADGELIWERPINDPPGAYGSLSIQAAADGRGGFWALLSRHSSTSVLQHFDADGHPLFWRRLYKCRPTDPHYDRDVTHERTEWYYVRTDPDAPAVFPGPYRPSDAGIPPAYDAGREDAGLGDDAGPITTDAGDESDGAVETDGAAETDAPIDADADGGQ